MFVTLLDRLTLASLTFHTREHPQQHPISFPRERAVGEEARVVVGLFITDGITLSVYGALPLFILTGTFGIV